MIVDFQRFAEASRPQWQELEQYLTRMETDPAYRPGLDEVERIHSLYQHACTDLARVSPLAAEPELKRYLEWLVSRAYCQIYASRPRLVFSFRRWFAETLPQTFRRHIRAFQLSVALTLLGAAFGALVLVADPEAKSVLLPFAHLQGSPRDRVAAETAGQGRELEGAKSRFSAQLITNNTRVSFFCFALGMTAAFGTALVLFYNGAILGAVVFDYVADGQTLFLLGWLLPHGVVEIPAIIISGQAGLVLGYALIGWGTRKPRQQRLRAVSPDLVTLASGIALMLVWAGIVEAFFSQYHEPVVPYALKIAFGVLEALLLTLFLTRGGR
jgi:uncharacterized membrane protein SpoIIM required for sporulation